MSTGQTRLSRLARDRTPTDYTRPHYVYRAFDGFGLLLYVGCTMTPDNRLATHRSGAFWYRYAASIGVTGTWERMDALRREREAIDTEHPFFNCSVAHMKQLNANAVAAKKNLCARRDYDPEIDFDIYLPEDGPEWTAYTEASEGWSRRLQAERLRLKSGAYPYLTDAERLERYLDARRDAALAMPERIAS